MPIIKGEYIYLFIYFEELHMFLRIFVTVEKLLIFSDKLAFFVAEALAIYLDMPILINNIICRAFITAGVPVVHKPPFLFTLLVTRRSAFF